MLQILARSVGGGGDESVAVVMESSSERKSVVTSLMDLLLNGKSHLLPEEEVLLWEKMVWKQK